MKAKTERTRRYIDASNAITYVPRGKRNVTVDDCGVEEVEGVDVNDDGSAKNGRGPLSLLDKLVVGLLNWSFLE